MVEDVVEVERTETGAVGGCISWREDLQSPSHVQFQSTGCEIHYLLTGGTSYSFCTSTGQLKDSASSLRALCT